ncbi:MAG: glycosyltransferase involved in cell wall biosynthesis [Francisellaceae bacterium]
MAPLLTVIIPTCNRHHTLLRAVESVVMQNVDDLEVIVVNDGNSELPEIIIEKLTMINNVKITRNIKEHGAANARNFGVERASGIYVTFLDDDDIYLPGRLLNMLSKIKNGAYIFVSSGRFHEVGDFNEIQCLPHQLAGNISLDSVKFVNDIDIGFLVSRNNFLTIGGFDPSFTNLEDWDLIIRLLKIGSGYKLERLDYAVNIDPNRPRVSNNDYKGYRELAAKYKSVFDKKWYFYMLAMADRLEHKLTATCAIKYSISSGSKLPFILYLKYKLQFLKYKKF